MSEPLSLDNLLKPMGELEPTVSRIPKSLEPAKTLESFHTQQIHKIREEKKNLPKLRLELAAKQEKLATVERQFLEPSALTNANDVLVLASRQKLEEEVMALEKVIQKLEDGTAEADYFLRVGDILFSYSDAQERIAGGEKPVEAAAKGKMPANSVYSYFTTEVDDKSTKTNDLIPEVRRASAITNTIGFKRDKALESYLTALNPTAIQHENSIASSITENFGNCAICESEMLFNETFLDCPQCGYRDYVLVDSEKPSYKDPPREMSYYAYKKINHLNEWLAQFQAKETTEISPAILDQIRQELRKERITDMSKLKPSKLKDVIKKLKLNRCYDHVAHILNRLNGISAPVLSREVEEKLRYMFKEIQFSFVKHCPKKRSNFLSYSFVLYKFCELLELDDYLPCFPLLKSREKLYMQDKIWQKICEDMGWEFIRTV
jgi:Zn finger protein HypA/HybF involved in hydrogenase expression